MTSWIETLWTGSKWFILSQLLLKKSKIIYTDFVCRNKHLDFAILNWPWNIFISNLIGWLDIGKRADTPPLGTAKWNTWVWKWMRPVIEVCNCEKMRCIHGYDSRYGSDQGMPLYRMFINQNMLYFRYALLTGVWGCIMWHMPGRFSNNNVSRWTSLQHARPMSRVIRTMQLHDVPIWFNDLLQRHCDRWRGRWRGRWRSMTLYSYKASDIFGGTSRVHYNWEETSTGTTNRSTETSWNQEHWSMEIGNGNKNFNKNSGSCKNGEILLRDPSYLTL